jgi:hypothetical protein
MSEIWRFQDQSPNKQGEALLYHVDLAAVICFVKHLNALQAWALTCLSHRCKTDLLWYCDVTFFFICGTIYFMWQLPEFATNFIRQGERCLMVVFIKCTYSNVTVLYTFKNFKQLIILVKL